jgi:hypothetical protein
LLQHGRSHYHTIHRATLQCNERKIAGKVRREGENFPGSIGRFLISSAKKAEKKAEKSLSKNSA